MWTRSPYTACITTCYKQQVSVAASRCLHLPPPPGVRHIFPPHFPPQTVEQVPASASCAAPCRTHHIRNAGVSEKPLDMPPLQLPQALFFLLAVCLSTRYSLSLGDHGTPHVVPHAHVRAGSFGGIDCGDHRRRCEALQEHDRCVPASNRCRQGCAVAGPGGEPGPQRGSPHAFSP